MTIALRVAPPGGGVRDRGPDHGDAQRPASSGPTTASTLTMPEVVQAMVGAAQETLFPARAVARGRGPPGPRDPATSHVDARAARRVADRAGRARSSGLAGLEGSGVSTLLEVLFGTRAGDGRDDPLPRRPGRAGVPGHRRAPRRSRWCPPTAAATALMLDAQHRPQHRARGDRRAAASGSGSATATWASPPRRQIANLRIQRRLPRDARRAACPAATSRRSSSASGWRSRPR